jgi:probable rRNA maturation factor
MIHVEINPSLESSFDAGILQKAGQVAMDHCQPEQVVDLTILLTDDDQVRELNKKYLNIDDTTDVLSFSSKEIDPDSNRMYLGDVIISHNRALDQARLAGHDMEVELQLLVIHGVLHLLDFDHGEPEQKTTMWNAQEIILGKLGYSGIRIVTEQG